MKRLGFLILVFCAIARGADQCGVPSISTELFQTIYKTYLTNPDNPSALGDYAMCVKPLSERAASGEPASGEKQETGERQVSSTPPEEEGCLSPSLLDLASETGGGATDDKGGNSGSSGDQSAESPTDGRTEGSHAGGGTDPKGRATGTSDKPTVTGCGLDAGEKLAKRMANGRLFKNSIYEIYVTVKENRWVPAQSGEERQCLRVATDDDGNILGKLIMTGKVNGEPVRSRFLGSMLPPDPSDHIQRQSMRFYDALNFSSSPYVLASCKDQQVLGTKFSQLIQRRPDIDEFFVRTLRFKGDPTNALTHLDMEAVTDRLVKVPEFVPETFIDGAGI